MRSVFSKIIFVALFIGCHNNLDVEELEKILSLPDEKVDEIQIVQNGDKFIEVFHVVGKIEEVIEVVNDEKEVEEEAWENKKKLTTIPPNEDDYAEVASFDIDIAGADCKCGNSICACCFTAFLPMFEWFNTGCFTFTFDFTHGILGVKVDFGEKVEYNQTFELTRKALKRKKDIEYFKIKAPLDFCSTFVLPIPLLPILMESCSELKDIEVGADRLKGCFKTNFLVLDNNVGAYDYGCITIEPLPLKRSILMGKNSTNIIRSIKSPGFSIDVGLQSIENYIV